MKYSRSIVSFALLASLGTGLAFAQDSASQSSGDSGAPAFSSLNDGKPLRRGDVPKDVDALKELRAHFDEADTNHDGKVDEGEYGAYVSKANARPQQQR